MVERFVLGRAHPENFLNSGWAPVRTIVWGKSVKRYSVGSKSANEYGHGCQDNRDKYAAGLIRRMLLSGSTILIRVYDQ